METLAIVLVAAASAGAIGGLEFRRRRLRVEAVDLRRQLADEIERTSVLARERDRIAEAFDALDDGVIVADAQGDELVRNTAARALGAARRTGVLADEASAALLDAARRGVPSEQELALVGPPRRVLALRAAPLWDRGRVVGAVVGIRDVTEPRRVDDVRRDFVANVSHELRTPIGALAVLAETMTDETDITVMRQFAERITREADRLARIVDDLLDLSQLEGAHNIEREIVDVRSLVNAAIEQVSGAAEAAHIEIRVTEIDPGLTILAERRQIVSAVFNLLDNAIKYSEPGSAVDIDVQVGEQSVAVMVRDHGVGIPTRDLERIFERFYRVDRARSRETGGTGLGLSIVRHVAQANDGEVSVMSHEGEGSAFTLSFPLVDGGSVRDEAHEETLR